MTFLARKEGLYFSGGTELYLANIGEEIVGMCGINWYRDHCKFKNDWVKPECRRRGYWNQMMNLRIQMAMNRNCRFIDATCTKIALPGWLKRGAVIIKKFQTYTKVKLSL